jgi:hypothetical protein
MMNYGIVVERELMWIKNFAVFNPPTAYLEHHAVLTYELIGKLQNTVTVLFPSSTTRNTSPCILGAPSSFG